MFLNFFLIKEANMFVDVKLVKPNTLFLSKVKSLWKEGKFLALSEKTIRAMLATGFHSKVSPLDLPINIRLGRK